MTPFRPWRHLKRRLPLIAAICALATAAAYLYLTLSGGYTAWAVIRFDHPEAQQGLTPLGTPLDVGEIKSTALLAQAVAPLAGAEGLSLDDLALRLAVTPVADEDEAARKDALLGMGEEAAYQPDTYIISFSARHREGAQFARQVLDGLLEAYFAEYGARYVNAPAFVNAAAGLAEGGTDYLELLEGIDAAIAATVDDLTARAGEAGGFRTAAGTSFTDLAGELQYLRDVTVPDLLAQVLAYRVTRDEELLLAYCTAQLQTDELAAQAAQQEAEQVQALMDAYVEKVRAAGAEIADETVQDGGGAASTYDQLMYRWRDLVRTRETAAADRAYYLYIMDRFTSGEDAPALQAAGEQTAEAIGELTAELDALYRQANAVNEEYNQYLNAQAIALLSTTAVDPEGNAALYAALIGAFLLAVSCGGAVLIGRLGEILAFYRALADSREEGR